jgi:hypothetical protein
MVGAAAHGDGADHCNKKEIDAMCLTFVRRAQADGLQFHIALEVLHVVSACVGKEARWLEACECHEDIWTAPSAFRTRQKRFVARVKPDVKFKPWQRCIKCPWKGKRASQMARERASIFFKNLAECSSPRLRELLARASGTVRTEALELMQW